MTCHSQGTHTRFHRVIGYSCERVEIIGLNGWATLYFPRPAEREDLENKLGRSVGVNLRPIKESFK